MRERICINRNHGENLLGTCRIKWFVHKNNARFLIEIVKYSVKARYLFTYLISISVSTRLRVSHIICFRMNVADNTAATITPDIIRYAAKGMGVIVTNTVAEDDCPSSSVTTV